MTTSLYKCIMYVSHPSTPNSRNMPYRTRLPSDRALMTPALASGLGCAILKPLDREMRAAAVPTELVPGCLARRCEADREEVPQRQAEAGLSRESSGVASEERSLYG